jgi:hypothetical protein
MNIERDRVMMSIMKNRLPDVGIEIVGGNAAGADHVIGRSQKTSAGKSGKRVGMDHEHFGSAPTQARDE